MHNFVYGSDDPDLPPSLSDVLDNLQRNEYLIRGDLNSIQFISAYVYNPGTGEQVQYYDSYNIIPGDWLANDATGFTWRISTIYEVTDFEGDQSGLNTSSGTFYAKMIDVDGFNAGLDQGSTFNGGPSFVDSRTILFTLNEYGFPIFTPSDTFNISANFSGNVLGRFQILNTYTQNISIYQTNAYNNFSIGDAVYIDLSGNFQSFQRIGSQNINARVNLLQQAAFNIALSIVGFKILNPEMKEFTSAADLLVY
jgi:hypothetical protein